MKKNKIYLIFVVLIGILISPLFFGCNVNIKINLTKPQEVRYQINQTTGREMLVTESNKYASSYIFGISEIRYDNLDKFLKYESKENYLDVTNIFKSAKTYYFYVQYKGEGKYVDSPNSDVFIETIGQKLETPYLSFANSVLSWSRVENATTYTICSEIDGEITEIDSTSNLEFDISNYINQKVSQSLDKPIQFFVYCNSTGNYLRSGDSNKVSYLDHLQLQTPTNLSITGTSTRILKWKAVKNAYGYKININNLYEVTYTDFEIQNGFVSYDVTEYFNLIGLGEYEFSVKSLASGYYIESDYSQIYSMTITQKLDTPTNLRCIEDNDKIRITWDAVNLANYYILEFSDVTNGNKMTQFIPNSSNGVNGNIITNSIILSLEDLKISNIITLKSPSFVVRVKAEGYGYYLDSDYSSGKDVVAVNQILETPSIVDDDTNKQISWNQVVDAKSYDVYIEIENEIQKISTTETSLNYSSFLNRIGEYKIYCYAIAQNSKYNSTKSNTITKQIFKKLDTPTINSVCIDGDYFVFDVDCDTNSNIQLVYVNGVNIGSYFLKNNPRVLISSCDFDKTASQFDLSIVSNSDGYFSASDKSNIYVMSTNVETPNISINSNILSWQNIDNASSYILYLDDKAQEIGKVESIDLTDFVETNKTRQIALKAISPYFNNSDLSNKVIYNRAEKNLNNYTNRYFYYGETYDYYITSEKEFFDLVEYSYLNKISNITAYIDYDDTRTFEGKTSAAIGRLTGTRNLTSMITKNPDAYRGEIEINIQSEVPLSPIPDYGTDYVQYDGDMVYVGNHTRTADHIFASDNYIVSQDVYSTDGLLSAIQHRAKPNFVEANSIAEQVYNKAKEILIEICDDDMTDYQKALAIHDYLVTHISYDYYGVTHYKIDSYLGYFHFIESALLYDIAVCDGYAKSFALLCNMEEIDCIVIDGKVYNENTNKYSGHAWNKIYIDVDNSGAKKWYAIDCTHDDAGTDNVEHLIHEYFMIPDSYIATRTEDLDDYPKAVTEEKFYSFYKFNGLSLMIDSQEKVIALKNYLLLHSTEKIEFIIQKDLVTYYIRSNLELIYQYEHNQDYYVCYTQ